MENKNQLKKLELKIHGMRCSSCEILIERKLREIPGVQRVNVRHADGKTEIIHSRDELSADEIERRIKGDGYSVVTKNKNNAKDYAEIGAVFLFIVAGYLILKQFNLIPSGLGVSNNMSYGFVFLMGLLAATSTCLAVSGGLLLTAAAKYNELYPNLTGFQKFKPTLYFNAGRVASYTLFGGVIGAIGSAISLSPFAEGVLTIAASVVMIVLGFQLLNLFPWLRHLQPKMPKFLAHKIHDFSEKDGRAGAGTLGALTFFLPCGFTQALQLYVLAKGSFTIGALTMLAFSLGTLPMLLSLGAVSSFAKGTFQKHFLRFSAALVIMLGFWNINNGLALTGVNISLASLASDKAATSVQPARIIDGKQIVEMKIDGYEYSPSQFTIRQGVPVEWRIDASRAAGCAEVITAPAIGLTKYLPPDGESVINFTPTQVGEIPFMCPMAMTTRGAKFIVLPAANPAPAEFPEKVSDTFSTLPTQKFDMEISRERGFYPNSFTVKKGVSVEIAIDDKVQLGGCMSVMVIPQYDVALPLKLGINTLTFTPTQTGTTYATCSMGIKMIQFNVI